jgi:hypothetical protein
MRTFKIDLIRQLLTKLSGRKKFSDEVALKLRISEQVENGNAFMERYRDVFAGLSKR